MDVRNGCVLGRAHRVSGKVVELFVGVEVFGGGGSGGCGGGSFTLDVP